MRGGRRLDRIARAGRWSLACSFFFIGMVKLGLTADHVRGHFAIEARTTTGSLHAVGAIEAAVSLLVILPAVTGVLPSLSAFAVAGVGAMALVGAIRPASALASGFADVDLLLAAFALLIILVGLAIRLSDRAATARRARLVRPRTDASRAAGPAILGGDAGPG